MKKFKGVALAFLLLSSFLLVACGGTATTPITTTSSTTVSTVSGTAASTTVTGTIKTTGTAASTTVTGTTGTVVASSSTVAPYKGKVVIASMGFTESVLLSEMYAAVLENAGIPVERKMNLGTTEIIQAALLKGDVSLYAEYTGIALMDVLKLPKTTNDPKAVYDTVAKEYASRYNLAVLDAAPFNDTYAIVVTKAIADKYNLKTLSDISTKASELRFATIADFIGLRSDADGLGSLQKTYGGFNFKDVKSYDINLKYKALIKGDADAATAFSTDGDIVGYGFVSLDDDKQNFPPYQVVPIIRTDVLAGYPNIKDLLNNLAPRLTNEKISALNWKVDGPEKQEAVDVARDFLKSEGLIK